MLGLASYDSDSDSESTQQTPLPPKPAKRAPKKIAIGLPSLPTEDKEDDEQPAAKKVRLNSGGAAKSSLFSMLPAPKKADPVPPAPQRVLGGGQRPGLVFNTQPIIPTPTTEAEGEEEVSSYSTLLVPTSVSKGRSNISLEEGTSKNIKPTPKPVAPAVDFFSLGMFIVLDIILSSDTFNRLHIDFKAKNHLCDTVPSFSILCSSGTHI